MQDAIAQQPNKKRIFATKTNSFNSYFNYLINAPEEFDRFAHAITINVSHFLRTPIYFDNKSECYSILDDLTVRK